MRTNPSAEELLTIKEVSAILRKSENEVRRAVRRGLLHAYKPRESKSWLVPRSAVDEYLTPGADLAS